MEENLNILALPQPCLEEIFRFLDFEMISKLGCVCRIFREISKTIFRLHFKNLANRVEKEMIKIETEANVPGKLTIDDHLHLALLHSVLRILLSEVKMLLAHCWRYIRDTRYDFCFPAGVILDVFEKILKQVRDKSLRKEMEPEITASLFHVGEIFYDYFDLKIETGFETLPVDMKIISTNDRKTFLPNIYEYVSNSTKNYLLPDVYLFLKKNSIKSYGENMSFLQATYMTVPTSKVEDNETEQCKQTPFGVKILDILDCCATSDYHMILHQENDLEGFSIETNYELRDINVLEALPTLGIATSLPQKKLIKICRYIRNNVRWTNLFHPLQDLWILEDSINIQMDVETASSLLRQWRRRANSRMNIDNYNTQNNEYDFRRVISRFKNRFGLIISAKLESPTISDIPLNIEEHFKDTNQCDKESSLRFLHKEIHRPTQSDEENIMDTTEECIEQINMKQPHPIPTAYAYKFNMELKIQYPSFLSDTVKEAILRVDQEGSQTIVTSGGDDIRSYASYRADEINEDTHNINF